MIDEATARALVEAHLLTLDEPGWSHVIVGVKRHPHCWAVGVQPYNPDGAPAYNLYGFEVDLISGNVTQWL